MNQKSNTRLLAITLTNFLLCLIVLVWLFVPEQKVAAQEPPAAFLGTIYYGSNPVTAIFDHQLPYHLGACIVSWQNRNFGRM